MPAVYLLVGSLAPRLAFAAHDRTAAPASSAGAVQEALAPAWGRGTLVLLVAGLVGEASMSRCSRASAIQANWLRYASVQVFRLRRCWLARAATHADPGRGRELPEVLRSQCRSSAWLTATAADR
jgi:hypothetical protein